MTKLGQYNLDEMTEQEVFEASCTHLLEQSEKSLDFEGSRGCLYNGGNNLCCAAGIFIQNYSEDMEGTTWYGLVEHHHQSDRWSDLIDDLQTVHDSGAIHYWLTNLSQVGENEGLDTTFLEPWYWDAESCKYIKKEG